MLFKSLIIGFIILLTGCAVYRQDLQVATCESPQSVAFDKADSVMFYMDSITHLGVPGIAIAVHSDDGLWQYASGYAKIEELTPLQSCHVHYLQSISKTYMAVAILRLFEERRIDLDAPTTQYLPAQFAKYISNAEDITIRMLLNHTSGIPEYNSHPAYVTTLLQDPDRDFTAEDYLNYIEKQPLKFYPGSRFSYCNTNYVILALIADAITGDHARYINEIIIDRLQLKSTFYRHIPGYLNSPLLYNCYWDRHSDGILENVSRLQRNNVAALIGDDGLVATPEDAIAFLKSLMDKKIISRNTLEIMQDWTNDKDGNPTYGLGLDHATFAGYTAFGHSGGGIGAGCQLYYFPDKGITLFIGINLGTVTESPVHIAAATLLDKLYVILLN